MPYCRASGFSNIMFGKPQISCFVFRQMVRKITRLLHQMAGGAGNKRHVCNKVSWKRGPSGDFHAG